MGWRGAVPLRGFAEHVLPWLWVTFGIAIVTGVALFYDQVHVGAHAYFTPKLIAIALGLVNASLFHRTSYVAALAAEARPRPRPAGRLPLSPVLDRIGRLRLPEHRSHAKGAIALIKPLPGVHVGGANRVCRFLAGRIPAVNTTSCNAISGF